MKLGAHPLVVAVAMGLVAPDSLTSLDPSEDKPRTECADCEDGEEAALPSLADFAEMEREEAELRALLEQALSIV